jgi:hypothetical protein
MKKTPTQIAKELRTENFKLQDCIRKQNAEINNYELQNSITCYIFIVLCVITAILGLSLHNMDDKFNARNKAANHYKQYIEYEQRAEYTASLCAELARVSGREFANNGKLKRCADYKVGFQTDNQIIDAIAHYALIKTDKK